MKPQREFEPGTTDQVSVVCESSETQKLEHVRSFTASDSLFLLGIATIYLTKISCELP